MLRPFHEDFKCFTCVSDFSACPLGWWSTIFTTGEPSHPESPMTSSLGLTEWNSWSTIGSNFGISHGISHGFFHRVFPWLFPPFSADHADPIPTYRSGIMMARRAASRRSGVFTCRATGNHLQMMFLSGNIWGFPEIGVPLNHPFEIIWVGFPS